MKLFTSCNKCHTIFEVSTSELKQASGRVRCGFCQNIFDAFDHLSSAEKEPSNESIDNQLDPEAKNKPIPVVDSEKQSERAYTEDNRSANIDLIETEFKYNPLSGERSWLSVLVFLTILAGSQWIFIERQSIFERYPNLYAIVIEKCSKPECGRYLFDSTVWLDIVSSELTRNVQSDPETLELTSLIRNTSTVKLNFPALELSLMGKEGSLVKIYRLPPSSYLANGDIGRGFAPGAELIARVNVGVPPRAVTDYRLKLAVRYN